MTTIQLHPTSIAATDAAALRLLCARFPAAFSLRPVEDEPELTRVYAECGAGMIDTDLLILQDAVTVGPYENGRAQMAGQLLACQLGLRLVVSTAPDRAVSDRYWATVDNLSRATDLMQVGRGACGSMAVLRALSKAASVWGLEL